MGTAPALRRVGPRADRACPCFPAFRTCPLPEPSPAWFPLWHPTRWYRYPPTPIPDTTDTVTDTDTGAARSVKPRLIPLSSPQPLPFYPKSTLTILTLMPTVPLIFTTRTLSPPL